MYLLNVNGVSVIGTRPYNQDMLMCGYLRDLTKCPLNNCVINGKFTVDKDNPVMIAVADGMGGLGPKNMNTGEQAAQNTLELLCSELAPVLTTRTTDHIKVVLDEISLKLGDFNRLGSRFTGDEKQVFDKSIQAIKDALDREVEQGLDGLRAKLIDEIKTETFRTDISDIEEILRKVNKEVIQASEYQRGTTISAVVFFEDKEGNPFAIHFNVGDSPIYRFAPSSYDPEQIATIENVAAINRAQGRVAYAADGTEYGSNNLTCYIGMNVDDRTSFGNVNQIQVFPGNVFAVCSDGGAHEINKYAGNIRDSSGSVEIVKKTVVDRMNFSKAPCTVDNSTMIIAQVESPDDFVTYTGGRIDVRSSEDVEAEIKNLAAQDANDNDPGSAKDNTVQIGDNKRCKKGFIEWLKSLLMGD